MAEAMALIGLVASVLQLVDTVASAGTFIKDLHNAPKEQQQLLAEITSLQPLLTAFQDRLLNNTSSAAGKHIKDPLAAFEDTMKRCSNKLQTAGAFSRVSKPISWTLWNKKEAKEDLDQVERFKSLLNTWLTVDIWYVGQQHGGILKSLEKSAERAAQEQRQHFDDAKRDKILEWMSPLNSFQRQADVFSKWQPGTGGWLLASPEFRDWELASRKTLWCRGMPGAGKTVLASLVVNHFEVRSLKEDIGLACFYLNYKEVESQTPQNLLGSLWRQLVLGKPIPAVVHALYERHRERHTRLPLDEVLKTLILAVAQYPKVYFIIDAVDEYPEEQRIVLLKSLGEIGVNVMLTSRPHIDPDSAGLPDLQLVEIHATENDMQQYIATQISKSTRLSKHIQTRPELSDEIRSKILNNVNGMFLLAKLHIDSLTTKNTIKAVREALHRLPKDLRHTYDEAMERIDHQGEDDRQLAHLILTWVANTKRPLSVGELREALAIEPDATDLDPENLLDISIILSVCAGLLIVDETASVVRLVHYTAQDYLDSIQSQYFPDAQTKITLSCLTYLSFQEFSTLPINQDEQRKLVFQHPFLEYSQYCFAHAVGQPELDHLERIILFLNRASTWKHFWWSSLGYNSLVMPWMIPEHEWPTLPLCVSVASNLETISGHLLTERMVIGTLGCALQAASYCGHLPLVQSLLEHDADIDLVQGSFGTALQAASSQGQKAVVQLLLDHSAEVNLIGGYYGTALQAAVFQGHEAVVQLLIQNGANLDILGGHFGTALQAASYQGNETLVQLLLDHGANVNILGGEYGTVLHAASYGGNEGVVQLLIQNGTNVNTATEDHGTALQLASYNGKEMVVRLLIQNGADVNVGGGKYGTALHAAAYGGKHAVVQLLLDHGVNVDTPGGDYGTPLQIASYNGKEAVVQLLIENGANVNAQGGQYGTALAAAQARNHNRVVELLQNGGNPNVPVDVPPVE
ncbi:hypothetical protein C8R44DRAFT_674381 [Mycena epipterygia]|nr:hypothetical protein C8R44DRAFT_674381 [Mycena epipterygia]